MEDIVCVVIDRGGGGWSPTWGRKYHGKDKRENAEISVWKCYTGFDYDILAADKKLWLRLQFHTFQYYYHYAAIGSGLKF